MKQNFTCKKDYYYGGERITFTKGKIYVGTKAEWNWEFIDDESDYFMIREDEITEYFGNKFKFGR